MYLVYLLFPLLLAANSLLKEDCAYYYSAWGNCTNSIQRREALCLCSNQPHPDTSCAHTSITEPLARPCAASSPSCRWRWTLWTPCSSPCGGGNTSRAQICTCSGLFASDESCVVAHRLGEELASCNGFACGGVAARTKYYWIERAEEGNWPLEGFFGCSKGSWGNDSSPEGMSYAQVLMSQELGPPQWLFLAKEWISARLNMMMGVEFSQEDERLIERAGDLLEQCDSWEGDDFYKVMVAKEKLGRLNNNIGGLEHVEEQMALVVQLGGGDEGIRLVNVLVLLGAVVIYVVFWIVVAVRRHN